MPRTDGKLPTANGCDTLTVKGNALAENNQLSAIEHVVVLMLENRSFDHMLGFLYSSQGNVSPTGQPFEGLTGKESNSDASGTATSSAQPPFTP